MARRKHDLAWVQSDLNDPQREAVVCTEGPVLILAGAGSGKTRVLTYRIAYILANGLAESREILAMTFTNKAAGEMRERVHKLVTDFSSGMWIGTFHSLFARLMRQEGERIGYTSNFSIYDEDDQLSLIKTILTDLKYSIQDLQPKAILYRISRAKNEMKTPADLALEAVKPDERIVAHVFTEYQHRLHELNAMDFDDLLLKPIELFQRFPLVMEYYQDRFHYILVDEYQDTNRAQYQVVKMLAAKHRNICVVGDDDQSIYRWRGAELRNILEFESDYQECKKFRLEQNYRSMQNILSAAHSVVKNNRQRHPKKLWTENPVGEHVIIFEAYNEREEAQYIVTKIGEELREHNRKFLDFSLLYRTNAQSRVLEDQLRSDGIPYIIVGGVKFYERKEIKDVLAYLRLITNPADAISLKRIINYPTRGIGDTTIARIETFARDAKITLYDAVMRIKEVPGISAKTVENVTSFVKIIEKYKELQTQLDPAELASSLVNEIGVLRLFREEATVEAMSRLDNVKELLLAVAEFVNSAQEKVYLHDFLQRVSLATDIDSWNDKANAVTLMTLHSAKGLEFSVVFITGLEDGLFPLSRSLTDQADLEEERRLFYVGATRAKEKLYLTWTRNRHRFGERVGSVKSRFLKEIDQQYVHTEISLSQKPQHVTVDRDDYESQKMPNYEDASQEPSEINIGMRVRHPTFGKGNIIKIESQRGTIKVVVLFDTAGERRLVLPYAKLEIL
jgi:DNA helicase II / ATP-dependent DNA helicase PcrA